MADTIARGAYRALGIAISRPSTFATPGMTSERKAWSTVSAGRFSFPSRIHHTMNPMKVPTRALAAAGAGPEHVVKWNLLVLEGQDLRQGFEAFQRAWGDRTNPPPLITGAFVSGLAHPDFLVEMDALAVVPE